MSTAWRKWGLALGLARTLLGYAQAQPALDNAGTHADGFIAPAITAILGSNPLDIDYDPSATVAALIADFDNSAHTFVSVSSGLPVNHTPYTVLNASLCQYNAFNDQLYYAPLLAGNAILTQALGAVPGPIGCGPLPAGTAPGVLLSAVTSPNSGDGASGWGIEFALSAGYKGLNTSEDSWDSAAMAGFLAAFAVQHPTWNWFDIKGAFRQTAANWATGWNPTTFGYGILDYDSATALPSTASVLLQPPGLAISAHSGYATITLYPFRTARRSHELLYSVNPAYTWPVRNEYTAADIAASGATLLYTSNGTATTPSFNFAPAASGTVTLIAFTTDGSGAYSRVEPFGEQSVTLTVGTSCAQP